MPITTLPTGSIVSYSGVGLYPPFTRDVINAAWSAAATLANSYETKSDAIANTTTGILTTEAQTLARPADFDFLHHIGESYATLRRYAPQFLGVLKLRAAPAAKGVLDAIDMLRGFAAKEWPFQSGAMYIGAVTYSKEGRRVVLVGKTAMVGVYGYTEQSPYVEYTWQAGNYNDDGVFQPTVEVTPLPSPRQWVEAGASSSEYSDTVNQVAFLRDDTVVMSYDDTEAPALSFYRFILSAPNVMVAEGRGEYHEGQSPLYDGAGKVLIGFLTADYVRMWPNNKAKEPYFVDSISVNAESGEYDPYAAFFY